MDTFDVLYIELMAIFVVFFATQNLSYPLTIFLTLITYCAYVQAQDVEKRKTKSVKNEKKRRRNKSQDSFKWVNDCIEIFWLSHRKTARDKFSSWLWPIIVDEINDAHISYLWKGLSLDKFYIGDEPPRLTKVSAWAEGEDLLFDLEVTYDGNAFFKASIDMEIFKIPITLQNVTVSSAKMRLVFKHCMPEPPFVAGVHFGFIETPQCDWDIKGLAGVANIPGFDELILHILNVRLTNRVVLPHMLILPFIMPKKLTQILLKGRQKKEKSEMLGLTAMLKPLGMIRVVALRGSNFGVLPKRARIEISLGDLKVEQSLQDDADWNVEGIFPIEHCHEQRVIVHFFDGKTSAFIVESVERIARQGLLCHWYQLLERQGKILLRFEAIAITNARRAIFETRAYGVISILLKTLESRREKTRPVVYLYLHEGQMKERKWSSLEPLCSSKNQEINEGTLLFVRNVLDAKTALKIRVWDARKLRWLGPEIEMNVKKLLQRPIEHVERFLENDVKFTFLISLFHY